MQVFSECLFSLFLMTVLTDKPTSQPAKEQAKKLASSVVTTVGELRFLYILPLSTSKEGRREPFI